MHYSIVTVIFWQQFWSKQRQIYLRVFLFEDEYELFGKMLKQEQFSSNWRWQKILLSNREF